MNTSADPGKTIDEIKAQKKLRAIAKKELKLEKRRLKQLETERKNKLNVQAHLDRELKYTALSLQKNDDNFNNLCTEIQHPLAKKALIEATQNFNHAFDAKQHTINEFKINRDQADQQYRRNINRHTDLLEYILKLYEVSHKILKTAFDSTIYSMLMEFHRETRNKKRISQRRKIFYESMLHASNLISINNLNVQHNNFEFNSHELNAGKMFYQYSLRDGIIAKMSRYHHQSVLFYQQWHDLYTFMVIDHKFNELVRKNSDFHVSTRKMNTLALKYNKTIDKLQEDLKIFEEKSRDKISKLNEEQQKRSERFKALNRKFKMESGRDTARLTLLVDQIHQAEKHLSRILKQGTYILQNIDMCQKYKTIETPRKPSKDFSLSCRKGPTYSEYMQKAELFMIKVSREDFDVKRLLLDRNHLKLENQRLREKLRQYCHDQTYRAVMASLGIYGTPIGLMPIQNPLTVSAIADPKQACVKNVEKK